LNYCLHDFFLLKGIGPKIAAELLHDFDTLDNLLANADKVKQKSRREKIIKFKDNAILSRELVELKRDIPYDSMSFPDGIKRVADLRMQDLDEARMVAFYDAMGFKNMKRLFVNRLGKGKPIPKPASKKRPKAVLPMPSDYLEVPF
jgi:DNA polymerase-1